MEPSFTFVTLNPVFHLLWVSDVAKFRVAQVKLVLLQFLSLSCFHDFNRRDFDCLASDFHGSVCSSYTAD